MQNEFTKDLNDPFCARNGQVLGNDELSGFRFMLIEEYFFQRSLFSNTHFSPPIDEIIATKKNQINQYKNAE